MYNRREFLLHTIRIAAVPNAIWAFATQAVELPAGNGFSTTDLQILAAAMDEIVPQGDGMPSATAVGGLQYLRQLGWQFPEIRDEIRTFLKELAQDSVAKFGTHFPRLTPDQRAQLLAAMEKRQASAFSTFTGYVYEAYYTNPRVLRLLSCRPSSSPNADDGALLAPVLKLGRVYREVL